CCHGHQVGTIADVDGRAVRADGAEGDLPGVVEVRAEVPHRLHRTVSAFLGDLRDRLVVGTHDDFGAVTLALGNGCDHAFVVDGDGVVEALVGRFGVHGPVGQHERG